MEESLLFMAVLSLCVLALFRAFFNLLFSNSKKKKLPPGPKSIPVIGSILWLRKSFFDLEPILRNLRSKYGSIITLYIGSRPAIFVGDRALAHKALVQKGSVFSDRPKALPTSQILAGNQHNISSSGYGPTWRLLRRNLVTQILHPSRATSFSPARKRVLEILISKLLQQQQKGDCSSVKVMEQFQHAMFCLLVIMCFGDDDEHKFFDDDARKIREIEGVQRGILLSFRRFNILNFWPKLGKILFRKRWEELRKLRRDQEEVLIPLIRARADRVRSLESEQRDRVVAAAYVDTLLELELPVEKRKLEVEEMVSLCSEFLNAGTDTTSTALQWIMANLVKYPQIQAKLYQEICDVMGGPPPPLAEEGLVLENIDIIKEDDLEKMKYLKAVVLEGLRRHPPGHFVLPHSISEEEGEVELDGYKIPKNATVNFMVAEMGWDPKVWENPMEFNPNRFLQVDGDLFEASGGSKEIKMMPFGAGRRMCPASGLAILHLEYFVANLIWYFHWKPTSDGDVDLSEKQEFTIVMKNPLQAHISPRSSI